MIGSCHISYSQDHLPCARRQGDDALLSFVFPKAHQLAHTLRISENEKSVICQGKSNPQCHSGYDLMEKISTMLIIGKTVMLEKSKDKIVPNVTYIKHYKRF